MSESLITLTVRCRDCGRTATVPVGQPGSFDCDSRGRYRRFHLTAISVPEGWGRINSLERCDACGEAHYERMKPIWAEADRVRREAIDARPVAELLDAVLGGPMNMDSQRWDMLRSIRKRLAAEGGAS